MANIIDMEAPMSTNPSTKLLLISTKRCRVLLQWFLLMLMLCSAWNLSTLMRLTDFNPSSRFFHASLTRLSTNSNSPRITNIISVGERKLFPLMKCVNIFDLIEEFFLASTYSISWSLVVFILGDSISKHFLRILTLIKNVMLSVTKLIQLFHSSFFIIN